MVKVIWNTVMGIQYQNTLHGFLAGKDTITSSLESKLLQQLTVCK